MLDALLDLFDRDRRRSRTGTRGWLDRLGEREVRRFSRSSHHDHKGEWEGDPAQPPWRQRGELLDWDG